MRKRDSISGLARAQRLSLQGATRRRYRCHAVALGVVAVLVSASATANATPPRPGVGSAGSPWEKIYEGPSFPWSPRRPGPVVAVRFGLFRCKWTGSDQPSPDC